ncbi:MAG TPA: alkaline phosphatase family protein [Thermoanaerobaculia bacterium]|nr:alkaline phosphatase family protein [Thermoanaerobaculia bacterium]
MLRSRLFKVLAMLAGMGAILYILASLYLPSSRRLIFGVNKKTGEVRVVENHVTFLPPMQFYRLDFERRSGWAQRDGIIRIMSQEQVPVTITYRLRFGIAGNRLPDARTLVAQGWTAWVGARVAEAVDAVTRQVPIEDLLSPNSQFNTAQRNTLRSAVANYLSKSGLKVTAFEIARIDVDKLALLQRKKMDLRREARGVAGRVAVFAIDGADWELLSELANDEHLPNIRALSRGGVTGATQTIEPTVAPLLWTTAATGLTPDRHGVIDFVDHARNAPVQSYSRHAPALWDIAEAFGRHAAVVNWWTAWPPTSSGVTVFDAPVELLDHAVAPAALDAKLQPMIVPVSTVGYPQIRRFLNITPDEFDRSVTKGGPADPVNVFRNVLAKTWSDHRAAIALYREQSPTLFMMEYGGTDVVNHLFAPYHPPYREGISQDGYRKYWPAVTNYYMEIDRLIGEWMTILPPDTTVIVMSAHGFRWGKNRPWQMPNGVASLNHHRNPGVFIAYGNHVLHGGAMHPFSVFDLTPTVLAILGLPQSAEMQGHVATWALRDVQPVETVKVVSYSEFLDIRPIPTPVQLDAKLYQALLQAVGHLNDPTRSQIPMLDEDEMPKANAPVSPQRWGLYAYFNNLGIELKKQGKTQDAVDAFDRAIDINPTRPIPYLNEAMTLFEKQQYTMADDMFVKAVERGLPEPDKWFVDFAALYRTRNMPTRAIALLYKGRGLFPQSFPIASNLGALLVANERYTDGLPELQRALGMQPSSTQVLNNLGAFFVKNKDYGRALDFWNRSLAIDPHQPQIHAAVDAAQARL